MVKISVGILGFGLSGRYFFAPYFNAHKGFEVKAIVTSQAAEAEKSCIDAKVYPLASNLFDDRSIDLVVVASPNATHFDYARQALLAGKHVIVEKPFTVTSDEANELISLSKRVGRMVIPFQNRRWDGDFLTVKKLIAEGALGEIIEFESHFDRYRPGGERVAWKNDFGRGVGNLYDLGPHLIDQALVLFGKPDFVYGDVKTLRENGENPDTFEIQLYYPTLKVTLKAGVMIREVGPRFVVHGRKGSFIKHGLDVQEQNLKDGLLPGDPLLVKDKVENYGLIHSEINGEIVRERIPTLDGNYMAYFENVYDALQGNDELIVKPEQAQKTIELIEKAMQSSKEKRQIPV